MGRLAALAVPLSLILIPVVLLAPNLRWPYHDAAIFGTIGEGFLRGDLPYRDLWDHKPPGIYLIAGLAALLPGDTWLAFWGLSVAVIAATGATLRPIVGSAASVIATACIALYPSALGGGQTETFACLPAAGALLAVSHGRLTWAGALAGVALLFSLQLLPLTVTLLFFVRPLPYVAGGFAVAALATGTIGVLGILPAAWDALITYNTIYLGSASSGDPAWHSVLVLTPIGVAALGRGTWKANRSEGIAAIWLLAGLLTIAVQGRELGHYMTPLVIPVAILAARSGSRVMMTGGLVALVVVIMTATIASGYPQRGPATERLATWVTERTGPEERILVWGVDANVYIAANRGVASRYLYLMPLVTPGYSTPRQIAAWIQELDANPPAVIVDSEAANPHWPEYGDFLRPPPPGAAGGRDLDLLSPFRSFVMDRYELGAEIDGRKMYQLRRDS